MMTTRRSGAALLIALGVLFLFAALGTAYVSYAAIETDDARLAAQSIRAQAAARGGVEAAIGLAQESVQNGKLPIGEQLLTFPVYDVKGGQLTNSGDFSCTVKVTVSDESGKVNINHVPRSVLEQLLNVDRPTARAIVQNLPHGDIGEGPAPAVKGPRRWLTDARDLVTRGLVSEKDFQKLDQSVLSFSTVTDPQNPRQFINVNAAAPKVLAALFNIPQTAAESAAKARPFSSIQDIATATGQAPANFNMPPPLDMPDATPKELAFQSKCFRVTSESVIGKVDEEGGIYHTSQARIEAVVVFSDTGKPVISYWSESSAEAAPAAG